MEIKRFERNPIITKKDVAFRVNSIFNAGAVKINGKYILLCRVEMPNGRSSFLKAVSDDGYNFELEDNCILSPEKHNEFYEYIEWGIEDPRITKIGEEYFITYTGYSQYMPLVMLAKTKDFESFEILGPISEPSNKDCALFPEKIEDMYWKVDRPSAEERRDIWISRSPDLIHWGGYKVLMEPEAGTWENDKVGGSTPPIKTDDGWLMLYHGVRGFGISTLYKVGVVLLDLEKPWIVKGKSEEPILSPEFDYERIGDVGNVVFTCGWIPEEDGSIKIYYSGADMNICVAETSINELKALCV